MASAIPIDYNDEIINIISGLKIPQIACIVLTDGIFEEYGKYGIDPNSIVGNVFTAHLTSDQIDSLIKDDNIIKISAGYRCELALDTNLLSMGAKIAIDSFGLTGKDVVIDGWPYKISPAMLLFQDQA